ncbi:MAG TPA: lytic transglycosylase domain-containing protein [Caulobacteraceae bacterium]|jgi:soluble lytic murein transglycosylase-like protein
MGRRYGAAALFAVMLAAGAAHAQVLEVHVDGGVVLYDGASQRYSRGAEPIARLLTPAHPVSRIRHYGHSRPMIAPPPETAEAIRVSAERHQVDAKLVEAVAWQESGFNRHAVSPKGARGTMQLMPATARRLGVDSSDFAGNIDGGANYLSQMMRRFDGNQAKALAAYNAGPGAVERYGGVPPYAETQAYVHAILGRLGHADEAMAGASGEILTARMSAF